MGWTKQIPEPDGGWTLPPGSRIWADIALARDTGWPLSEIRALDELDRVALLSYLTGLSTATT